MYNPPHAVEELKQPRKHPTAVQADVIKETLKHFNMSLKEFASQFKLVADECPPENLDGIAALFSKYFSQNVSDVLFFTRRKKYTSAYEFHPFITKHRLREQRQDRERFRLVLQGNRYRAYAPVRTGNC